MGRGSSGGGGGSGELSEGSGKKINIISQTDVWSYRHNKNNEQFVDEINTSVRDVANDFPGLMNEVREVNSAKLGGKDKKSTLGFYGDGVVAINDNYVNVEKMNSTYDAGVKSGHHPSRGNKTGTQAVAYHELGHALTDYAAKKMGKGTTLDAAAKTIVQNAYNSTKGKDGTKGFAAKISKYATENFAECVAEAVCDHYCNGRKAKAESKAIMKELRKYK